jgi:hypothetical protein
LQLWREGDKASGQGLQHFLGASRGVVHFVPLILIAVHSNHFLRPIALARN